MVANANPMLSAAIFTKIQSGMRPSDGKVYCAPRNNREHRIEHVDRRMDRRMAEGDQPPVIGLPVS